jgi:hypothetical protein
MTEQMSLIRTGILLAGILMACAVVEAQVVRYDFMSGTDFSKWDTYRWVSVEGGLTPSQIMDVQIRQSI